MFRGGRTIPVTLGRRRWSKRKSRRWWIRGVLEAWWDRLRAAMLRLCWSYSVQAGYLQSLQFWGTKLWLHTPVTMFEACHVHVLAHSMMTYAMSSSFAVRNRKAHGWETKQNGISSLHGERAAYSFVNPRCRFRLNGAGAMGF